MRGPQTENKGEVRIQPPAEARALREAAEAESEPARGFAGAPAQGAAQTAPVETFAGPDPADVQAVGEIVKLFLETVGYVMGGLKPKLLRSIGQGIFQDADGAGDAIAPGAAMAVAAASASGHPISLQMFRWTRWIAMPVRYGLGKAAPERFAAPKEPPPRQPMQPGGSEPAPRAVERQPEPPASAPALVPSMEIVNG